MSYKEQIISKDKYPSIFSPQMEAIVFIILQIFSATRAIFKIGEYSPLLKTGSLDNAIREFSLAKPSWCMSHYTMIYKNGERMRDFSGVVFIVV